MNLLSCFRNKYSLMPSRLVFEKEPAKPMDYVKEADRRLQTIGHRESLRESLMRTLESNESVRMYADSLDDFMLDFVDKDITKMGTYGEIKDVKTRLDMMRMRERFERRLENSPDTKEARIDVLITYFDNLLALAPQSFLGIDKIPEGSASEQAFKRELLLKKTIWLRLKEKMKGK